MTVSFRYPKPRKQAPPRMQQPEKPVDDESLTGYVQGREASDLEERLANGIQSVGASFRFQMPVQTFYTTPDNDKQVDFVIYQGGRAYPIEVYGPYFHETSAAKVKDAERERHLNDAFRKMGYEDLRVVWYWELFDQEAANDTARRLVL